MAILISKINHLGDMVVFLPTLKAIKDHFHNHSIIVLTTPIGKAVIENALSNIMSVVMPRNAVNNYRSPFYLAFFWLCLQKFRFKKSYFSYDEPSISYLLASSLNIPVRIGFQTNIARFNTFLTKCLDFSHHRHVVDLNFDLARDAASNPSLQPEKIRLKYSDSDLSMVRKKLSDTGIATNDKYAVIHAGTQYSYRTWPMQKFAAVADYLESINVKAVFIGANQKEFPSGKRSFTATSISELACIIDNTSIFIGNNSGPMNVASVMGTPSIVICGPSALNWRIFWNDTPNKMIYSRLACVPCESLGNVPKACKYMAAPSPCMDNIELDEVIDSVKDLLR